MKTLITAFIAAISIPLVVIAEPSPQDDGFAEKARAWLLDNPEVLLEAMQVLEAKRAIVEAKEEGDLIAANNAALFDDARDGYAGADDGEAVGVEFFDYQCGYCKRQYAAVESYLVGNPGRKIILKEFPILGPVSETAARAALAARAIGGNTAYLAVHTALLQHQGKLDDGAIDAILAAAGLDASAIRARMGDEAITGHINANRALATQMGINGTPGWVFGNAITRGLIDRTALESKAQ